jgi:Low iron-inducible periplasmic protein
MRRRFRIACVLASLSLAAGGLAACGDDDGSGVREVGDTAASASGSGSGSGSASGATATGAAFGGYQPASDVTQHARVSLDVVAVNEALDADPVDFAAARAAYAEGGNSTSGDGAARTLRGFATERRDEPVWNDYVAFYGSPVWLDAFVSDALAATGDFAGAPADVRTQGVQKGVQNGVMVAWTLHELVAAREDVAAGELDPAEGAAHKVDEAWAFYHGEDPSGAPFATADKRGEDFGTGSAVNEAMLDQFSAARDAALAGEAGALDAAVAEIRRQLLITYIQAALKYSATTDQALADGDLAEARVQQAEGLAFFRVVAPLVAEAGPAAARTVIDELDVGAAPRAGIGARVSAALEGAYPKLGITAAEIGAFTG